MASFGEWTDRLKAWGEYLKAEGEYRKSLAEADLTTAKANKEKVRVNALKLLLKQIGLDLKDVNGQRNKMKKEITRLKERDRKATRLLAGRFIMDFLGSRRSFNWFLERALLEAAGAHLYDIPVPPGARDPSKFVNCRTKGAPATAPPDSVANGLELAGWMLEKQYIAKTGSPGQKVFRDVAAAVNTVAGETAEKIGNLRQSLQDRVYSDDWRATFSLILGVPSAK